MTVAPSPTAASSARAWGPLALPLFRGLWIASLLSNLGTLVHSVGAAWLMTTLSASPTLVALVQAAASLPLFLLALPAGALADIVDRRRLLLGTQAWMLASATGLGLLTLAGAAGPWALLGLTGLLSLGAALNGPAWQAILPELVPREHLPAAIALGSVNFNIARAAGPALGGALVAAAGPEAAFLANALSFLGVIAVLYRWSRPRQAPVLPAERFLGAMATGLRYVRYAPEVRAVIVRGAAFVFCASALWALLPLVARTRLGSGPVGYGLLLGALGVGAIAGVLALPHLKRGGTTDLVVAAATLVFAATTAALAFLEEFGLACLVLVLAGGAWVSHLSSLNVAIQTAVPSWVRARALSVYILGFFAALTAGSALSGMLAERLGTERTLLAAAGGMVLGLGATARYRLRSGEGLSLAPSRQWPAPIVHPEPEPDRGPVMVTVRYRVDPQRSADFIAAIAELRRIRLRDGAMQWGLFADASEPSVYVELFLVKSWVEHLRQHERATVADLAIAERVRSFHVGGQAPAVEHLIGERVPG